MAWKLADFDGRTRDVFLYAAGESKEVRAAGIQAAQKEAERDGLDYVTEEEVIREITKARYGDEATELHQKTYLAEQAGDNVMHKFYLQCEDELEAEIEEDHAVALANLTNG